MVMVGARREWVMAGYCGDEERASISYVCNGAISPPPQSFQHGPAIGVIDIAADLIAREPGMFEERRPAAPAGAERGRGCAGRSTPGDKHVEITHDERGRMAR